MKVLFIYPTMVTEVPMALAGLSAIAKQENWETVADFTAIKKSGIDVEDLLKKL